MKKMYAVLAIILLAACKKNTLLPVYSDVPPGIYTGQFATVYVGRDASLVYYQGISGKVTVNLHASTYNCTSPTTQFGAQAAGRYIIKDDVIAFRDSTIHTANFDWSIILSGDYQFEIKSDSLFMNKVVGSIKYDYRLKRQ